MKLLIWNSLHYAFLASLAVICIFPFWWTCVTALSGSGNLFEFPPTLWPRDLTLQYVREVFEVIPMWAFFKNSIWLTLCTVFWKLLLCSLAAYPLSCMQFSGRKLVLAVIFATMVLPSEVNFLVNFITISQMQLVDTYTGVILPNVVNAMSILLLKQAFDSIPPAIIEAARIDGASDRVIWLHIMLPLIAPWLATVGVLTAVESWNDYLWPSLVISQPDDFPLAAGILYLRGTFGTSTRVIAAGTLLTILPILLVFLFAQRFFMRGMEGAVK
jgi:putative chitobiose transport system permease protein